MKKLLQTIIILLCCFVIVQPVLAEVSLKKGAFICPTYEGVEEFINVCVKSQPIINSGLVDNEKYVASILESFKRDFGCINTNEAYSIHVIQEDKTAVVKIAIKHKGELLYVFTLERYIEYSYKRIK